MLKNISIKRKLFLLIIVVFAISITTAAIYAGISFMNSSKKVSKDIAKVINNSYIVKIETELQKGISTLKSISLNLKLENQGNHFLINNTTIKSINKYFTANEEITDFFFILADNKKKLNTLFNTDTIVAYNFAIKKTNKGIQPIIYNELNFRFDFNNLKSNISKNEFIISEPFIINNLGNPISVVTIAKPVFINNKIIGAVGINFSLSSISEVVNSITTYDENAKLILLTENEDIIFVSQKPWLTGKDIKYSQTEEQKILSQIKNNEFNNIGIKGYAGAYNTFKIPNTNIKWQIATAIPYNVFITELISDIYISIIIASLIMIIGLFIVIYFIKKSFSPVDDILLASQKISKGEPIYLKNANQNTEFGKIALSFNLISENLEQAANISSKIANGDYNIQLKPKSEKDILSISINKIAKSLKEAKEKSVEQDKNTFKQLWMRRGRFEVAEAERKSENNIHDLTFNILREIVNYTGAILGGLYLYNSEKEEIKLYASYAFETKKQINKTFKLGEGLIGSCVLEQKKIIINDVPDDYINIVSGLGSGKPSTITIIPIFYQGKINAVIELAFIKQPEDYVIEFVERLSDNIGAWIDASLINSKTAKLLETSREQTKKLAEKENELKTKVQELEKIKAELDIQNTEYKSMMNAINHTVMTVEYTLDGTVINSNAKYEEIMGYKSKEIIGTNVFELVKDQKEDLAHIIKEVAKGNPVKRLVKRYTKSGDEKILSATYTPYYNEKDTVSRVLFFAHDVTGLELDLEKATLIE